jgi:hypothetical protein
MSNLQVPFILNFFSGEDFNNQKDTLVELPTTLFELVTQATEVTGEDLWDIVIDEDELPDFYTELLEEVMDMDDGGDEYFNGGVVKYEHGNNLLVVSVDPVQVRGVPDVEKRVMLMSQAVMADLGNYLVAVKFYIIDPDPEQSEFYDVDPEEEEPTDTDDE